MILGKLLCKLPRWLGGDHKWRRLTKNEREAPGFQIFAAAQLPNGNVDRMRICRRCGAERVVKARKKTTKETT